MKVALVGCGSIARVHTRALMALDGVTLAACADIRPERAQALAEVCGGRPYNSLEAMLEAEKPDALHICTPHYLHVPMAIEALRRGVHVFMEKPPAIDEAQLEELLRAAEESKATLGVCFQNRYNPSVQRVRQLLAEEAGTILGARAFVTWRRDAPYYTESGWRGSLTTEGGGVLINQSIHTLDLLRYLLGEPVSVEGTVRNHHLPGVIEVEDTAEAYVRFADSTALFYASTAYCTDAPVMIEIACEKMTLRLEEKRLTIFRAGGESTEERFDTAPTVGKGCWGGGHQACIADFYESLAEGRPFPIDGAEAGRTLRLMRGIYRSSETGTAVSL